MPKVFSTEEKDTIISLFQAGKSPAEIASAMATKFPDAWNSKDAVRSIRRILNQEKNVSRSDKTLDEMTREERFLFIERKLQSTPRFKITFKNFAEEEKALFVEEYLSIIKSTDSLTEIEEQALFAGILELILALQALSRKEREEKLFEDSMAGKIRDGDPSFRRMVDDRYQKEYDSHMKLYQKAIDGLKMSRTQRLKEVRSQKQTLVDLSEELSSKNAQAEVADEIARLSKLKDDELLKMINEGHIFGIFNEFK
jgi:hypothetical protein